MQFADVYPLGVIPTCNIRVIEHCLFMNEGCIAVGGGIKYGVFKNYRTLLSYIDKVYAKNRAIIGNTGSFIDFYIIVNKHLYTIARIDESGRTITKRFVKAILGVNDLQLSDFEVSLNNE